MRSTTLRRWWLATVAVTALLLGLTNPATGQPGRATGSSFIASKARELEAAGPAARTRTGHHGGVTVVADGSTTRAGSTFATGAVRGRGRHGRSLPGSGRGALRRADQFDHQGQPWPAAAGRRGAALDRRPGRDRSGRGRRRLGRPPGRRPVHDRHHPRLPGPGPDLGDPRPRRRVLRRHPGRRRRQRWRQGLADRARPRPRGVRGRAHGRGRHRLRARRKPLCLGIPRRPDQRDRPERGVVRIRPSGRRTVLGQGALFLPGGIAVDRHGHLYVANWSILPATGSADPVFPPDARGQVVRVPTH